MFFYITLLVSVVQIYALSPQITSATFTEKAIAAEGAVFDYVVYEVETDQDLYYVENWPCECSSFVPKMTGVLADETGFDVVELTKGEWLEDIIDTEMLVFKFQLKQSDYAEAPIVQIYIANHWGQVNAYIAHDRVPQPADYDLTKYAKARDSIWICPNEFAWSWGWWYISVVRNEPYPYNHFQITWNTTATAACDPLSFSTAEALTANVGYHAVAETFIYQYFTFVVRSKCTDFAVAIKQTTKDFGDIDLYVSVDGYTTPNIDRHNYASQNNGNDAVAIMDFCSDKEEWSIYIGIYAWQGDQIPFVITATTTATFQLRAIADVPPQQFLYTFSYGQASIMCAKQEIRCEFYAYAGCLDPYDIWFCCARFGFLPPHEDPFPWIVLPAAAGTTYKNLPRTHYPSLEENVNRKLVMVQYLSRRTLSSLRVFSEINDCSLNFNNMITNALGESLPSVVRPVEATFACIEVNNAPVNGIIAQMTNTTNLDELLLLDIELARVMNAKPLLGCKQRLQNMTTTIAVTNTYEVDTCYNLGQNELNYYTDPCCSWNLTGYSYCRPKIIDINDKVITASVTTQCASSVCVEKNIENYARQKSELTCLADWTAAVGNVKSLGDFIFKCTTELLGPFDLQGIFCKNNEDCATNVCDRQFGRCVSTLDDLIDCWWSTAQPLVVKALFNFWRVPELPTKELFSSNIRTRYIRELCTGPGSLGFRSHYSYELTLATCVDDCVKNNITLQCFNTDRSSCPVDRICPPGSATACYRYFQFFEGDNTANCEASVNDFVGVCLDCSQSVLNNGSCTSLPLNKDECLKGLTQEGSCSHGNVDKNSCVTTSFCEGAVTGCFTEANFDFYGWSYCGKWGCYDPAIKKEDCNGINDRWLDATICDQREACLDSKGFFNYQNKSVCEYAGNSWQPYFQTGYATWTAASTTPLLWQEKPLRTRTVKEDIDYILFHKDVLTAVGTLVALEYGKSAICRAVPLVNVLTTIVCDCIRNNDLCYNNTAQVLLSHWACPFLGTNIEEERYSLRINNDSVPATVLCQVITLTWYPVNLYQSSVTTRLSSQTFIDAQPNVWTLMYDYNFIVSGQLVTDALAIAFEFTPDSPLEVCLNFSVTEEASLFDNYRIAIVDYDRIVLHDESVTLHNNSLCTIITTTGTYIGVKVRETDGIYTAILVQSIVAAVLYGMLLLGVVYQIVNLLLVKPVRWQLKTSFAVISGLFLLIRVVYFIMFPTGAGAKTTTNYVFFEFPTFLFMVMNSVIVFLWIEIANTVKRLEASPSFSRKLFITWLLWNASILLCSLVFVILYYTIPRETIICSLLVINSYDNVSVIISRAYVLFVASICLILAVLMIAAGIAVVFPHMNNTATVNKQTITFLFWTWCLMATFTVCFVVKSALMIAAAFTNLIVPIIVFALLEVLPTAVLLYYIRPPISEKIKNFTTSSGKQSSKTPRGQST